MIAVSNKNLKIYTDESSGCGHRIEKFVVRYMILKVGDRQQMVYQETDHGPFSMMDDEEYRLSFFLFSFGGSAVPLYAIFIILATCICLYTSYTPFLINLCSKVNQLVV